MATPRVATRSAVETIDFTVAPEVYTSGGSALALLDNDRFSTPFALITNNNVGNISASGREDFYRWQALRAGEQIGISRGNVNTSSASFPTGAFLFGDTLCFYIKQDFDWMISTNVVFTPAVFAPFENTGAALPVDYNVIGYSSAYQNSYGGPFDGGAGPSNLYTISTNSLGVVTAGPSALVDKGAFNVEPGSGFSAPCTLREGTERHTIAKITPVGDAAWRLTTWTPTGLGDARIFTDYDVELSDAADNALLVALSTGDLPGHYHNNGNQFLFTIYEQTGGIAEGVTAFVVDGDCSAYRKVNIVYSYDPGDDPGERGDLSNAFFYRSSENEDYLYCRTSGPAVQAFILYGGGTPPEPPDPMPDPLPDPSPGDGSPKLRSWGFTLDDHDFYVSRIGNQSSLVYASRAKNWAPWASEESTVWRPHQGLNWSGMGPDNYDAGATSNVVVGDDTTGILWTLDPSSGVDDTTAGSPTSLFTRTVTGGVPARNRFSERNALVQMTADVGDPISPVEGARMFLETSDDNGKTWINRGWREFLPGDTGQRVYWRSLGLVRAPGRLFRFIDYGATTRIDGVDIRVGKGE